MSNNIFVNDTVRIKVKFVDIDPNTLEQTEVEPVSVSVSVLNSSDEEIDSGSATSITGSQYYYDFSSTNPGEFTVKFTGTLENGTYVVVNQQLYVSSTDKEYKPAITLRENETIYFAPELAPLYLDPEELLPLFPDASLIEIGELIHNYSHEINQLYGITTLPGTEEDPLAKISGVTSSTYAVIDYIRASVACELSRTYGFGSDDELSVQLGDLSIGNKTMPRSDVNRANATTWCQIAAALRKEILSKRVTLRGVQPKGLPGVSIAPTTVDPVTGTAVYLSDTTFLSPVSTDVEIDPITPDRKLKKYD